MHEVKDTQRALVRIGYDGRVHKIFRGPEAYVRFTNEVRVLRYLQQRGCDFVPRLLEVDEAGLGIVTTNCGSRVDQLTRSACRSCSLNSRLSACATTTAKCAISPTGGPTD